MSVDAKAVFEVLNWIGLGRPGFGVRPEWRFNELQYASVYFGLAGEDSALRQLLKRHLIDNKPGRYVDIGCAWPSMISNTYYLYTAGWRGIGVDANRAFAPMWADKVRSQDTFIWGAVSEENAPLFWLEHATNLGASLVRPRPESPSAAYATGVPVPSLRMDTLFERHIGNEPINLLCLDIEGTELSALRSNDWNRWRPEIILMECADFSFESPKAAPTVSFLYERGYRLEAKIAANVIMVREDLTF